MQIKKNFNSFFSLLSVLIIVGFLKNEKRIIEPEEDWVGSITYSLMKNDEGDTTMQDVRSEWKFYQRTDMLIIVKGKNKGVGHITNKIDNWQQITSPFVKEMKQVQITTAKEKGEGQGEVEVWVEMDKVAGTYWIKTDGPEFEVERKTRIWSNIIAMGGGDQPEGVTHNTNPGIPITIPDQRIPDPKIGKNPNVLSGSYVIYSDRTKKVLVSWSLRKKCPPWNNPLTQQNISTLEPKTKAAAARFIQRVNDELCIKLKVASAYRTKDEQDALYAIGRDKNGKKIGKTFTNAKGGQSKHNSRTAIDVYYATDTGIDLDTVLAPEIVEIARQEGFSWGGNWSDPDYPHFEMNP